VLRNYEGKKFVYPEVNEQAVLPTV
jgi:hypothetical protein